MKSFERQEVREDRGVALIVVLSAISLLTLIIMSMTLSMRMEGYASFFSLKRSQADMMAQEGVEVSRILLADLVGKTNNYTVTMPGRILSDTKQGVGFWKSTDLTSGSAGQDLKGLSAPANLNRKAITHDGLPLIDPQGPPLPASWIYVRKNGERIANLETNVNRQNPIIGRYAFWVDDESTKLNVNTAWKRQSEGSSASPSQIPLEGIFKQLSTGKADQIQSRAMTNSFQSSDEVGLINPDLKDYASTNRFFLTHYNFSQDKNPWGEPKIYLTTQKANLPKEIQALKNYTNYFLDIFKDDNTDPGGVVSGIVDFGKLTYQITRIDNYMNRTNWPYFSGMSFAQKYNTSGSTNRTTQIALDIIDYVRSAETTNSVVGITRLNKQGSNFVAGSTGSQYMGTSRHPMITEIGLWLSDTGTVASPYTAIGKVEVYLPPHYGLQSFNLVGTQLYFTWGGLSIYNLPITANMLSSPLLLSGEYVTITTPPYVTTKTGSRTTATIGMVIRASLGVANPLNWWDHAPNESFLPYTVDPIGTLSDNITSVEVDDPRVNKLLANWIKRPRGNSFGAENSIWKKSAKVSSDLPSQDLENGQFSDYSLFMPPPKGEPGNELGIVSSVAELGRVCTGIDFNTKNNGNLCIPWRTLRLQPTRSDDKTIPDWALLDLFSAVIPAKSATATSEDLYFRSTNAVYGKININSRVAPFEDYFKTLPLKALFHGKTNTSLSSQAAAENISHHVLASGGRTLGNTDFFKSPGELAEINGIADSGEKSEQNLLSSVDLATVRSEVFRVYCVGQSVQQTPTGDLTVNASKSLDVLLESYWDVNQYRFRPVSRRESPY